MIHDKTTTPPQVEPSTKLRRMTRIDTVSGEIDQIASGISANAPGKVVLAEGDSWLDKFTPIPVDGTNLLDAIRTPFEASVVDIAQVGDTSRDIVSGWQLKRTRKILNFFDFDAIILSVGANDLKNLYAGKIEAMVEGGLTATEIETLLQPATYSQDFASVVANVQTFISLRDASPSAITRSAPILLNGYDYFQPRPAKAEVFAGSNFGPGPWVYPALHAAGLSATKMKAAADAVINELNRSLCAAFGASTNVHVIDTRGILTPAPANSTSAVGDWLDEIHPSKAGFDKLAALRWSGVLSSLLV